MQQLPPNAPNTGSYPQLFTRQSVPHTAPVRMSAFVNTMTCVRIAPFVSEFGYS
ncbi:hypothetical protein F2P81_004362, partial [Scophthalmus maximus]